MIVWIASFPRSGNTFMRMLLHQRYGIRTGVVYNFDGVADRLGPDTVGYTPLADDLEHLRLDAALHFIKTHRCATHDVAEGDAAIYLVRDGRDALVSWARQKTEGEPQRYEEVLEDMTDDSTSTTGTWGANVLSWVAFPGARVVPFVRLISDPVNVVDELVSQVLPGRDEIGSAVPTFGSLHRDHPDFFRRGMVGSFKDEMPSHVERRFWEFDENRRAMDVLGGLT